MLCLDIPSSIEVTGFISQDLVAILVGSVTAKKYLKILPTMAVFKCAHTIYVNKTALTWQERDSVIMFVRR